MSDLIFSVDLNNGGAIVPCYSPLYAVSEGMTSEGKHILKFNPDRISAYKTFFPDKLFALPCGQCIGCRLERSRQWANRCMLELQYHPEACFITLTYDDDHVPTSYYADPDTGEAFPVHSLCRRDVQLFMKRLRKFVDRWFHAKIRFYGCGEYGPETLRPHYHLIVFGWKPPDLVPWEKSDQGYQYYLSDILSEIWGERCAAPRLGYTNCLTFDKDEFYIPRGNILVGDVSWDTCAYVARYCTGKLTGVQSKYYDTYSLVPPFSMMSNRPGIAAQWYQDHPDCYEYDYIHIPTPLGGRKFRPPRYFDKLFDIDQPDQMADVKLARKKQAEFAVRAKTHLSYYDEDTIRMVEEASVSARLKTLSRKL